jgi:methylation protein EvaC
MPIANNFLNKHDFKNEYFFEMKITFCEKCFLFQLVEQPEKSLMFHDDYMFYSSLSNNMKLHFKDFFNEIKKKFLDKINKPFIIEIGCNDGILLENFKKYDHLGVDPSKNVLDIAKSKGLKTQCDFVSKEVFEEIKKKYSSADIIIAANVICHIPEVNNIFEAIETILAKKGVFVFEEPYLGDVYKFTTFDQIYDEHVFLFSLHSVEKIAKKFNLNIFDAKMVPTHGGSMRYYVCREGVFKKTDKCNSLFERENAEGINKIKNFRLFTKNCLDFKKAFNKKLLEIKTNHKICAYAATSKSTTLFNFCEIDGSIIDCIFDSTPKKQGLFSPGMHIPVIDAKRFLETDYDVCVLLAYNHADEIKKKEKAYKGKWLEYYPQINLT